MTKEEAWRRAKGYLYDALSGEEADEIIKALEQEPCEDAISRENVINLKWQGEASEEFLEGYANAIEDARELPSVKQEPKTGYWIDIGSGQECSECHEIQCGYDNFRRFCASCGIRMIEPQKSEVEKNDET